MVPPPQKNIFLTKKMPNTKRQDDRLLDILDCIRSGMRSGRLANCSTMATELGVTRKTILRDLDYLRHNRHAPIAYDGQRWGYYYTEASYVLPSLHLNEGDLLGMVMGRKLLEQYQNTPLHSHLATTFNKITQSLPKKVTIDSAWVDNRVTIIPDNPTTIDPAIWNTVAQALQQERSLTIVHQKPDAQQPRRRTVDPYHLTGFQGGWYLIGHCHLRGEVRFFALSRISEASMTTERFYPDPDFDYTGFIQNFIQSNFGIIRGEKHHTVRLRFTSKARPYVQERIWQEGQKMEVEDNGSLLLTLAATDLLEITRWILSWGADVRVLEPPELVEEVRSALLATERQYQREAGE